MKAILLLLIFCFFLPPLISEAESGPPILIIEKISDLKTICQSFLFRPQRGAIEVFPELQEIFDSIYSMVWDDEKQIIIFNVVDKQGNPILDTPVLSPDQVSVAMMVNSLQFEPASLGISLQRFMPALFAEVRNFLEYYLDSETEKFLSEFDKISSVSFALPKSLKSLVFNVRATLKDSSRQESHIELEVTIPLDQSSITSRGSYTKIID